MCVLGNLGDERRVRRFLSRGGFVRRDGASRAPGAQEHKCNSPEKNGERLADRRRGIRKQRKNEVHNIEISDLLCASTLTFESRRGLHDTRAIFSPRSSLRRCPFRINNF